MTPLLFVCLLLAGLALASAQSACGELSSQLAASDAAAAAAPAETPPAQTVSDSAAAAKEETEARQSQPTQVSVEKVRVEIPPPVLVCWNRDWPEGRTDVLQQGMPGAEIRVLEVSRRAGEVVGRKLLRKQVITKPREQVVMRGARELPSRSRPGPARLAMAATAYDPGPRSCGRFADGYTSIGLKAGKGVVAVDPKVIPLGTKLYIPGYGVAVAGDVGSAIKGKRIDLGYATYKEAIQFGRRQVLVYLLHGEEPAPAPAAPKTEEQPKPQASAGKRP